MYETPKNTIEFKVCGKYALFTDPVTRVGGEKCTYLVPTYEAVKGIVRSIYWKPTLVWVVDEVRVIRKIQTETKGIRPIDFANGGNTLSIYTYLKDVEYQVRAHFEWNENRQDLIQDRNDGKHYEITKRSVERGGRQDIFLGTRECQGYVEPCAFGSESGAYDDLSKISFGVMFHGFDYPDDTGKDEMRARFWDANMEKGIIKYPKPEECKYVSNIKNMKADTFSIGDNMKSVDKELENMEIQL